MRPLDIYLTIFELIDMHSFSNLWYWIMLAVVWSMASHWVLGVPFDMVMRARREEGEAQVDLEDIVRVNINRLEHLIEVAGLWVAGFSCFFLTMLFVLAVFYNFEFATALLLLVFPLGLVFLMSLATANTIRRENAVGEQLRKRLTRHRIYTQIIGMVTIFVTAFFGMLNLIPPAW